MLNLSKHVKFWLFGLNDVQHFLFFNTFSFSGAVLDESTGKVLVVQDRNKVSLLQDYKIEKFI